MNNYFTIPCMILLIIGIIYYIKNNKLYSKLTENSTYFVHDNGWDHGSPRFHDALELNKLYLN